MRDLDLFAQITLGVNFSSKRSEIDPVIGTAIFDLETTLGGRLDVVFAEGDPALQEIFDRLREAGLIMDEGDDAGIPGLSGFLGLSEMDGLVVDAAGNLPEAPEDDATPPATEDETGGTAPPLDEARLPLDGADGQVTDQANAAVSAGGWKMTGWRVAMTEAA